MPDIPKIFISYARENQDHQDKVLALADWFESNGVEVIFDQYEPNPPKPWPIWMEEGLRVADYVLCVCTPAYKRRVEHREPPGIGLGVQWEGGLIYNCMASNQEAAGKYQVVQFDESDIEAIPTPLQGNNRHLIGRFDFDDPNVENLYRVVTNQPKVKRPSRGQLKILGARERLIVPRLGNDTTAPRIEMPANLDRSERAVSVIIPPSRRQLRPASGSGNYLVRLSKAAMNFAIDALDADNLREAVSLLLRAHELDGQNKRCLLLLGNSYYKLHDYQQAVSWLTIAHQRIPDDIDIEFSLLLARYFLGGGDEPLLEGLTIYENSLKTPGDTLDYAGFLSNLNRYDEAIDVLESTDPPPEAEHRWRGSLAVYYWFKERTQEAVDILESLPKSKFEATDWINLGVGRAELNRFGLAIEAINQGLRIRPRYQFASYALAQIYALMGEEETAISKLQELLAVDSVHLHRVEGERTFSLIRKSDHFQAFLAEWRTKSGNSLTT